MAFKGKVSLFLEDYLSICIKLLEADLYYEVDRVEFFSPRICVQTLNIWGGVGRLKNRNEKMGDNQTSNQKR